MDLKLPALILLLLVGAFNLFSQNPAPKSYCNPINLDYGYTPIPNFAEWGKHRATADPVIVHYKGEYYLFSTNQWGYWWSSDLAEWNFVSRKFLRPWNEGYDELCAPAVGISSNQYPLYGVELDRKTMDKDVPYYFCIEAINDNGVSERSKILQVK